jgi:hypothetical protein
MVERVNGTIKNATVKAIMYWLGCCLYRRCRFAGRVLVKS